ncbi:MAG: hypothetical protein LBI57_06125 [Helicobacteraceae bacterium]|jgi:hypothetical protein|nr:hypothetical protein [Helicobacteraceae bacterium]
MARKEKDDALLEFGLRFERWAKRNRILLGSIAAALVVWGAAYVGWGIYENVRLQAANSAFEALVKNPADVEALAILQAKSPELYDLFLLGEAANASDVTALELLSQKRTIVADLAAYQLAAISSDPVALGRYAMRESALRSLKDLAALQEAYLLLKQSEWQSARAQLNRVDISSDLKSLANALEHYGADKK